MSAGHKYLDRFWKNGKWNYVYDTMRKGAKQVKRSLEGGLKNASADARIAIQKSKIGKKYYANKNAKAANEKERRNQYYKHRVGENDYETHNRLRYAADEGYRKFVKEVKRDNELIPVNNKGRRQTAYYRDLPKKLAAAKARKKQNDLDEMTSGGSKSDRRRLDSSREWKKVLEGTKSGRDRLQKKINKTKAINTMTSGGSASDKEALRKAAGKKRIAANNKAIAANKKGKTQTEYYKNLQKKQASKKAAQKQADLDKMTSSSAPLKPGEVKLGVNKQGVTYRVGKKKKSVAGVTYSQITDHKVHGREYKVRAKKK